MNDVTKMSRTLLWSSASPGCTARTGRPFESRYPLRMLGTKWCRYPKGAGPLHLVHYMHDGGARTGTRYPEYLPTRSGDRQYERSEWPAHYCFLAGWARYRSAVGPGTSVAWSSNQGCAELDQEATRRLDGEACNRPQWQRASAHS